MSMLAWHGWDSYPIARLDEDAAAERVKADLARWDVNLDLASCIPSASTPIIVQEIRQTRRGATTHKFSWSCLRCGGWLPSFKPVTQAAVEQVEPFVAGSSLFFFDRVSRGTLDIAKMAAAVGAVVMFEPSGRGDDRLFREALQIAHIVKYADQRMSDLAESVPSASRVLEVQTLGAEGLRFRAPRRMRSGAWRALQAAPVTTVADSCGSGDWCTSGLLKQLAADGISGLEKAKLSDIFDALQYGQELAAWNCQFEGARGGMYFENEDGRRRDNSSSDPAALKVVSPTATPLVACPKCAA
jgi:fructokinase